MFLKNFCNQWRKRKFGGGRLESLASLILLLKGKKKALGEFRGGGIRSLED
jgi:hypothetical protein